MLAVWLSDISGLVCMCIAVCVFRFVVCLLILELRREFEEKVVDTPYMDDCCLSDFSYSFLGFSLLCPPSIYSHLLFSCFC